MDLLSPEESCYGRLYLSSECVVNNLDLSEIILPNELEIAMSFEH